MAILHGKFEVELARQATRSAEASKKVTTGVTASPNLKRSVPSNKPPASGKTSTTKSPDLPQEPPVSTKKGKKKKRSALANASNPHHLKNYVPSRLPNSGQANSTQNANYLSPAPLQFLSARLPPRRKRYGEDNAAPAPSTLTNPTEEWICPFCEHKLFYGDEVEYQWAIRNRKKVLKRRRRAQERAAAAASGKAASNIAAAERSDAGNDDGNREVEHEGPYARDLVQGQNKSRKAGNSTIDEGSGANTASSGV